MNYQNLPSFYENYKIYIERETEDDDIVKMKDGIFFNKLSFEKIDDLVSTLDAICLNDEANNILNELKIQLGLEK